MSFWPLDVLFLKHSSVCHLFVQEGLQSDKGSAWPVANPILTCASIKDPNNPSNFVADPFLFSQVRHETRTTSRCNFELGSILSNSVA